MTIGTVITGGFGSFGSASFVITDGFSIGEEVGGRGGRGRVTPRMFGWPRITSQVSGNTQRLIGGAQ